MTLFRVRARKGVRVELPTAAGMKVVPSDYDGLFPESVELRRAHLIHGDVVSVEPYVLETQVAEKKYQPQMKITLADKKPDEAKPQTNPETPEERA